MADALLRLLLLLWFPLHHGHLIHPSKIRLTDGPADIAVVIFPPSRAGTLLDKTADTMERRRRPADLRAPCNHVRSLG